MYIIDSILPLVATLNLCVEGGSLSPQHVLFVVLKDTSAPDVWVVVQIHNASENQAAENASVCFHGQNQNTFIC